MNRLDGFLLKYGNGEAILTLSELDGFLVALASSPVRLTPNEWLLEVTGGREPRFKKSAEAEAEAFSALLMRYMNNVAGELSEACDDFEPLFLEDESEPEPQMVVDEWCFGYLRGVQVARWPALPPVQAAHLEAIALHGLEDNIDQVEALQPQQHDASIEAIVIGLRALYGFFDSQRA
ncbi:UPF0149 family protein [Pseudomonas sp. MAFF 301350]|uniref:UPF0149 family protein n=2 Tax=Pseudomonas aegrilactucae TaxID=2854028 RepID=A0A9Q3AFG0_9PSED|nr:UPF0149 family protein [Pseudomonas aegrilactucae]